MGRQSACQDFVPSRHEHDARKTGSTESLEAGLKATSVTWVRSSRRAWLIDINGLRKNLDQFEVGEESEPLLTDADWFQGVVSKVLRFVTTKDGLLTQIY